MHYDELYGWPWDDLQLVVRLLMCILPIFHLFEKARWCTTTVSFLEPIRLAVRELWLTVGSQNSISFDSNCDVKPLQITSGHHQTSPTPQIHDFQPIPIHSFHNWKGFYRLGSNPYKMVSKQVKSLEKRELYQFIKIFGTLHKNHRKGTCMLCNSYIVLAFDKNYGNSPIQTLKSSRKP